MVEQSTEDGGQVVGLPAKAVISGGDVLAHRQGDGVEDEHAAQRLQHRLGRVVDVAPRLRRRGHAGCHLARQQV
jgi:hypothetical protein